MNPRSPSSSFEWRVSQKTQGRPAERQRETKRKQNAVSWHSRSRSNQKRPERHCSVSSSDSPRRVFRKQRRRSRSASWSKEKTHHYNQRTSRYGGRKSSPQRRHFGEKETQRKNERRRRGDSRERKHFRQRRSRSRRNSDSSQNNRRAQTKSKENRFEREIEEEKWIRENKSKGTSRRKWSSSSSRISFRKKRPSDYSSSMETKRKGSRDSKEGLRSSARKDQAEFEASKSSSVESRNFSMVLKKSKEEIEKRKGNPLEEFKKLKKKERLDEAFHQLESISGQKKGLSRLFDSRSSSNADLSFDFHSNGEYSNGEVSPSQKRKDSPSKERRNDPYKETSSSEFQAKKKSRFLQRGPRKGEDENGFENLTSGKKSLKEKLQESMEETRTVQNDSGESLAKRIIKRQAGCSVMSEKTMERSIKEMIIRPSDTRYFQIKLEEVRENKEAKARQLGHEASLVSRIRKKQND